MVPLVPVVILDLGVRTMRIDLAHIDLADEITPDLGPPEQL
jgi:hypothetical protein